MYNESNRTLNLHNAPNRTLNLHNEPNRTLPNRALPNESYKDVLKNLNRSLEEKLNENLGKGNNKDIQNNANKSPEKIRRENYGSCVSNGTKDRNSCFKTEKESFKTCEQNARNVTKIGNFTGNFTARREMKKQFKVIDNLCKDDYKASLKECRVTFNSGRMDCNIWRCNSNQTLVNGSCIRNK